MGTDSVRLQRPIGQIVAIGAALLSLSAVAPAPVVMIGVNPGGSSGPSGRPMPLVDSDDMMVDYLVRAERYIADGAYDRAIEILQALITLSLIHI